MRHHFQISRYNAWSRVESVFKEKIKRENGENYNLAIGLEEISLTTTFTLRLLFSKSISFAGCLTQYFFAVFLGTTEFYRLIAISYDHYAAICKPLHYTTIMSNKVCIQLVLCSWLGGILIILSPIILTSQLDFCVSNIPNHYYCDNGPLIEISCSDIRLLELVDFILAVVTLLLTLVLVILSCTNII
uniref:G-protein coupled receptors family 1 profile domain-containing protein n=1 Tax=Rousettus aegyptiacus TaxID=9407 RepID=A0A7J8JGF4_ROUAE|nr:hypothetical protein HJG63_010253 [Rousettus aegyptiacus]